jgi:hypothetical protein
MGRFRSVDPLGINGDQSFLLNEFAEICLDFGLQKPFQNLLRMYFAVF